MISGGTDTDNTQAYQLKLCFTAVIIIYSNSLWILPQSQIGFSASAPFFFLLAAVVHSLGDPNGCQLKGKLWIAMLYLKRQ